MAKYLVVAHQTAESEELVNQLIQIDKTDPHAEFVLLVPATPINHLLAWEEGETTAIAKSGAAAARQTWTDRGLRVIDDHVGDLDPLLAIEDEIRRNPGYHHIVISTFAPGVSRWLGLDLISRVRARTGLPVTHVAAARPALPMPA